MFDDKLKATYCIASSFAKWSRLLCKCFEDDAITTRNQLLELSQSLPLYCAAAGSTTSATHQQEYFQNALDCTLKLSSLLQALPEKHIVDKTLIREGVSIIDVIIVRLTDHLPTLVQTSTISTPRYPAKAAR